MNVDNLMYIKVSCCSMSHSSFIDPFAIGGLDYSTRMCINFGVVFGTYPFQHYTFYDFIVNKARGKSGPLFNFDVHDDVRLLADATKEKDESHAGKVVERSWYNRNKHIFPASRWEVGVFGTFPFAILISI